MRKTYGNTWWGQQWLNALTQIDYSNRLPRGRSYANKGTAGNLDIHKNTVLAKVKGSRKRPYQVDIRVPAFSSKAQSVIINLITANPLLLSRLLNRTLPTQLHDACRQQRVNIFPHSRNDLQGSCSCPDWAVPCKHMAAVLYLVANEIDKNPFLVFELHDFDLFKGLEGAGYAFNASKEIAIAALQDMQCGFIAEKQIATESEWDAEVYAQLDFSAIPACRDQLLALLSENPLFYPNGDFKKILEKAYIEVAKSVSRRQRLQMAKKEAEIVIPDHMDAIESIELILDPHAGFVRCLLSGYRSEGDEGPGRKNRNGKTRSLHCFECKADLIDWLQQIPPGFTEQLSPMLRGLVLSYRLAEKPVLQNAFIPQLIRLGHDLYKIRWRAAILNEAVHAVYQQVAQLVPPGMLFYQPKPHQNTKRPGKQPLLQATPEDGYPALLSVLLEHFVSAGLSSERFSGGHFDQNDPMKGLFFQGVPERFDSFESREYPGAIQLWLSRFSIAGKNTTPVLQVEEDGNHFVVNIAIEDKTDDLTAPITLADFFADDKYQNIRLDVLRDLSSLSGYFPELDRIVESQGVQGLRFDADEFVQMLFQVIPIIRLFGIKILLPKALKNISRPRLSMQIEGSQSDEVDGAVSHSGLFSMESMLHFQWRIALGDELITPEVFLQRVANLSGIVKLKDQYLYFDEKEIAGLLEKLRNPPSPDDHSLLQTAISGEYQGVGIQLDDKARSLLNELLKQPETELPMNLLAQLRPYQISGYQWLYKNSCPGPGSLIADDMGLGKTLQVITTLLKLKQNQELQQQKGLIIVPATLLTNWQHEVKKFAPDLKVHVYHGPGRDLSPLKQADLLITTYGMARSENALLQKHRWRILIIDEAQNIKNPATSQTKAVKKIKAPVRIAMSGTPVENRLSEYWSIIDFANKGYPGTLKKFKDQFARPIEEERDQHQLERFRQITAPFILRRWKTDKSIIQDLPDKIETDRYCQLSTEQAALYQNVLQQNMENIEQAEGIDRRGQVLKLITALKQICNHPGHFLKTGNSDPLLSGKSQLLLSLLQQTLDNGEKTLIFTRFQEMGALMVNMLAEPLGLQIPFLHGGVSRKKRDQMVSDFQHNRTSRILLLSLKAGGTGLNLPAASNVIHYDLWWNPAVEAQATDRAYRIGQNRNVQVHRFISKGTFEEKINTMIQQKKELAGLAVKSG